MTTEGGHVDTMERDEVLSRFARVVYGNGPTVTWRTTVAAHLRTTALNGQAQAHQMLLRTDVDGAAHVAQMTVLHPSGREDAPLFVGLNFRGNHTISTDAAIPLPASSAAPLAYDEYTASPQERGMLAKRWPLDLILERGFGIATVCYLQLGPDSPRLRTQGLLPMLDPSGTVWGGLGLWAWYLCRMSDALRQTGLGGRQIAYGHSRLGKAALWAGAQSESFDGAVANDSGCMGASLSVSPGAETPALLASVRPYWFTGDFGGSVESAVLPTQDVLIAAIAPRPVYIASAADDVGADPEGERLAVEAARRINPGAPVGHHRRAGGHDVTSEDWAHFLDYFSAPDRWSDAR